MKFAAMSFMFLLWLLLLATMAQGVLSLEGRNNDERSSLKGYGNDDGVSLCVNGGVLCSVVKNRKLMIKDGTQKEDHSRKKHEKDRYRFDLQHKQRHDSTAETYPDLIDIAGMDYSPAKRKPPIHN